MTAGPQGPPASEGSPGASRGSQDHTPGSTDDGDGSRTFEALLGELEALTDRLAGGELGIEAATDLYERAERLHGLAAARLEQVRGRVDRLRQDPAPPTP